MSVWRFAAMGSSLVKLFVFLFIKLIAHTLFYFFFLVPVYNSCLSFRTQATLFASRARFLIQIRVIHSSVYFRLSVFRKPKPGGTNIDIFIRIIAEF